MNPSSSEGFRNPSIFFGNKRKRRSVRIESHDGLGLPIDYFNGGQNALIMEG